MIQHVQVIGFPRSGVQLMIDCLGKTSTSHKVFNDERSFIHFKDDTKPTIGHRCNDLIKHTQWSREKEWCNVILMVRDIRDVMTSFHPDVQGNYFLHWNYKFKVLGPGKFKIDKNGLGAMISGYDRFQKSDSVLLVHYEGLLNYPNRMQEIISRKLGIKMKGNFSECIYKKKSVGRWKDHKYRDYIIQEFNTHAELFEILIRDGYEQDTRWIDSL